METLKSFLETQLRTRAEDRTLESEIAEVEKAAGLGIEGLAELKLLSIELKSVFQDNVVEDFKMESVGEDLTKNKIEELCSQFYEKQGFYREKEYDFMGSFSFVKPGENISVRASLGAGRILVTVNRYFRDYGNSSEIV